MFYTTISERGKYAGNIKGFPCVKGSWCKKLKYEKVDIRKFVLSSVRKRRTEWKNVRFSIQKRELVSKQTKTVSYRKQFFDSPKNEGRKINIIQYLGIAADEPKRIAKHIGKPNIILPLVEIGWEEDLCGLISGYQNLLSPTYETSMRDGCWFCHNQGVGQLRNLRKKHPDLWALLLKWDADSPVTFKPDGHTVKDFDERFALEDQGLIAPSDPWKWSYLTDRPMQLKMNF